MQTNVYVNSVQFYLQNKKHFDGKKDNDGVGHPFLSFKSPSSSSVLLVSVILRVIVCESCCVCIEQYKEQCFSV